MPETPFVGHSPFVTLADGFTPQNPVGAQLSDAFRHMVSQALAWSWPAHPRFVPDDLEVRPAEVRRVLDYLEKAFESPGGRLTVEPAHRTILRRICNTLEVGRMHENHVVLDSSTFPWSRRLLQAAAKDGKSGVLPVRDLLGYLDEPEVRGLDRAVSGLILRVFALMEDLAWYRDGVLVVAPLPEQVSVSYELRQPKLPKEEVWSRAVATGREALGLSVTDLRNAANLQRLGDGARELAQRQAGEARELERLLAQHREDLQVTEATADRWTTAAAVRTLLDALMRDPEDDALVQALADTAWSTTPQAARRSIDAMAKLIPVLRNTQWNVLRALANITDDRKDEAQALLARLGDTAARDELSASLVHDLPSIERSAIQLLTVTPPPPPPVGPDPTEARRTVPVAELDAVLGEMREAAERHTGSVTITWRFDP